MLMEKVGKQSKLVTICHQEPCCWQLIWRSELYHSVEHKSARTDKVCMFFMQEPPYHMTETATENNNETRRKKKESTGYDNSLKLKNSGVNQSWNNVMLQNVFVLRGGGKGRGGEAEMEGGGRRSVCVFSARLGLEIKMQKLGPLRVCGVCVCGWGCVCANNTLFFLSGDWQTAITFWSK